MFWLKSQITVEAAMSAILPVPRRPLCVAPLSLALGDAARRPQARHPLGGTVVLAKSYKMMF